MVGARELLPGEAPALHSTRRAALAEGAGREAAAVRDPRRASRARCRPGAGRVELGARGQHEPARSAGPGRDRRGRRTRDRPHPQPRRARPDDRGRARGLARRALAGRRLRSRGRCSTSSARSRRRSCTCCSRRGASSTPTGCAAELCESPHGLADALVRLEQASELVEFRASPATEPLYTINPFAEEGLARLFVTHPPVGERVRRLRDLDPDWREKLRAA